MRGAGYALPVDAVVLAAGKGTRMKSDLAKVLHRLGGEPLLVHVLRTLRAAGIERTVVVVGHQAERVRAICPAEDLVFVHQEPQLGTGHAVQVAAPALRPGGLTVVLNGDVPLLRPRTLQRLVTSAVAGTAAAVVLTSILDDAGSYGRILKDSAGRLTAIVEARDATPTELAVKEFNTGVFCFRTDRLLPVLQVLSADNDQKELYLTDSVGHLVAAGEVVETVLCPDPNEVGGVNTVAELAAAERLFLARRG